MKSLTPLALSFLLSLSTSTSIITNTYPELTYTATAYPSSDLSETSTIISDTSSSSTDTPYTYPPSTLYPTTLKTTLKTTSSRITTTASTTPKTTTRTTTRTTTTPISSSNSTGTHPPITPTPNPQSCKRPSGRCYCKPGADGHYCGNDINLQNDSNVAGGCDANMIYRCFAPAHDDPGQKPWIVGGDWCPNEVCDGECVSGGTPAKGAAVCKKKSDPKFK